MNNSFTLDRFIEEAKQMPWFVIEKIAFVDSALTTMITFRSGNAITATSHCPQQYEAMKNEARKQLEASQILIQE